MGGVGSVCVNVEYGNFGDSSMSCYGQFAEWKCEDVGRMVRPACERSENAMRMMLALCLELSSDGWSPESLLPVTLPIDTNQRSPEFRCTDEFCRIWWPAQVSVSGALNYTAKSAVTGEASRYAPNVFSGIGQGCTAGMRPRNNLLLYVLKEELFSSSVFGAARLLAWDRFEHSARRWCHGTPAHCSTPSLNVHLGLDYMNKRRMPACPLQQAAMENEWICFR
ncbi:hypothetical protein HPB50_015157 [Hyalomma asiaticum]|uniref:Uncharacterized protein n=1 Tax=Hyalomma asiaticum TaxID=266040 RepID=A0ACB7SFI7_HYAAI|nr:hypothetical protein HPB50_015157 [Hyalomma asiaticum]